MAVKSVCETTYYSLSDAGRGIYCRVLHLRRPENKTEDVLRLDGRRRVDIADVHLVRIWHDSVMAGNNNQLEGRQIRTQPAIRND